MAAGAALAAKRGKRSKSSLRGASKQMEKSMSEKQLEDFAKTKRKTLSKKRSQSLGISPLLEAANFKAPLAWPETTVRRLNRSLPQSFCTLGCNVTMAITSLRRGRIPDHPDSQSRYSPSFCAPVLKSIRQLVLRESSRGKRIAYFEWRFSVTVE